MNLILRVFLDVSLLFIQIPSNSARSVSPTTQEKLRLIRQWLDTTPDATVYDYIYRINKGAGLNLFEGDIKGYNPRHHRLRTAVTDHKLLWNSKVIPYMIDPAFDSASRKEILAGIEEFHKKTCLKFAPRKSAKEDHLIIKPVSGCYSNVGRTGGEQVVSLEGPCLKKGTAIHELMHALGFWHEQNRPDRDKWVQIIVSNIQIGKAYNFDKLLPNEVDTLNEQYDYGSIMHYSKYAFSKNGNPTIIPIRRTDAELGQREGLSQHDVNRINKLYKCGSLAIKSTTGSVTPPNTPYKVTKTPIVNNATPKQATFIPSVVKSLSTTVPIQPPKMKSHASPSIIQLSSKSQSTSNNLIAFTTSEPLVSSVTPYSSTSQPSFSITETTTTKAAPGNILFSSSERTQPSSPIHVSKSTTSTTQVSTETPITLLYHKTTRGNSSPNMVTFEATRTSTPTKPPSTMTTALAITSTPAAGQTDFIHSWTSWSSWTECDIDCKQSRFRECAKTDRQRCPGNNTETQKCPDSCQPAISLGCWKENPESPFIPSVEGLDTSLIGPYKARTMAIRQCANYAARNDFTVFAVFDGGMCRTGPTAYQMYNKGGPSETCSDERMGSEDASSVFSFEKDINGGWGSWTGWSECTKSCNVGQQYRFRQCDAPPPTGNGTACMGARREVAVCNLQACPINSKCGRPFYAGSPGDSGYIWVRDYDNFMECEYHIMTVDPQSTISLLIQDMDIEYSRGCIYDALMLFDGRNSLSALVGTFCGEEDPGSFESSTNHVYLKFESDETKVTRGFTVLYTINNRSKKACVRPSQSPHMIIHSEGNMVGDHVFFMCNHGYKLVGHPNITCVDQPNFALWDDTFPRCISVRKRSVDGIQQKTLCTFESSLCGFTSHPSSDFYWRVHKFENNSVLKTQSSRLQAPGDVSRIISSIHDPGIEENCLEFQYMIEGGDTAILNVHLIQMDISRNITISNNTLLWTVRGSGTDGWNWVLATISIVTDVRFQIMFEAVLWEEIGSMVQIDEVRISPNNCSP